MCIRYSYKSLASNNSAQKAFLISLFSVGCLVITPAGYEVIAAMLVLCYLYFVTLFLRVKPPYHLIQPALNCLAAGQIQKVNKT